jgi:hypothetical protein
MKSLKLTILSGAAVMICLGLWLWIGWAGERELNALFSGDETSHITRLSFSGQKRSIEVTDTGTLNDLENAIRNHSSLNIQLGLTYRAKFMFRSGRIVETTIYVHDDGGGVSIENPAVKHAGDPQIVSVRFKSPVSDKLRTLSDRLK